MNVTVVTQPQTTTYNVQVTRNETTYNVAVSLQRGPIGPQGPQGAKGDKGDTGPAGLTWRMVWDAGTQYAVDDAVYYSGSSYYAVAVPDVGTAPDPESTSPWMELAIMGQKGDKGDTGATGPAGAGVPDTATATPGEVVRWNGTTTEWADLNLGTAATVDVGTSEGNVPALDANGKLPTSTYDTASLSHLSGTLATDVSLVTSATTTILTITGLTAGTWLVTVNITIAGGDSTARAVAIQAAAGTGSPALAGQTSTETYMNNSTTGGTVREAVLTLTFLVTCTGSSTVIVQSPPTLATAKASTSLNNLAHASGWTAVKIA